MEKYIVQIIACGIGALGYALIYNVKKDKVLWATIGGILTIVTYILVNNRLKEILISTAVASVVITVYSEILARKLRAPATIFLLPGIIPLVPGGGLFYTMTGLLTGSKTEFNSYGINTLETAVGIAVGVIIASVVFRHLNKVLYKKLKKNQKF